MEHIGVSLRFSKADRQNLKSQISNPRQAQNLNEQILKNIISVLNTELNYNLKFNKDFRIEFYDISNTAGREATGSMVVWQGSDVAKDQYRKFKIKFIKGPNDVGMMREVLWRRIKNLGDKKFQTKSPDLIILDGGKPQLGEIYNLFASLNIKIPFVSLAKKEEIVFGIKNGAFQQTSIAKNSQIGFFVQKIRDEAHRFAIGYHKNLRSKKMIGSRLDEIEGVGPVAKKKLILKFGSVDGIIKADIEDIALLVGKKLASKIKENL